MPVPFAPCGRPAPSGALRGQACARTVAFLFRGSEQLVWIATPRSPGHTPSRHHTNKHGEKMEARHGLGGEVISSHVRPAQNGLKQRGRVKRLLRGSEELLASCPSGQASLFRALWPPAARTCLSLDQGFLWPRALALLGQPPPMTDRSLCADTPAPAPLERDTRHVLH